MKPTAWTILPLALLVTACGTVNKPAPTDTIQALRTQPRISVAHYQPAPFAIASWTDGDRVRHAGFSLLGPIGQVLSEGIRFSDAKKAGAEFISLSQLADPMLNLQRRFLPAWERELGLSALPASQLIADDSPAALRTHFEADYVLDFKTEVWAVGPVPSATFDPISSTYLPRFTGRARLVRLHDQQVEWEGSCDSREEGSRWPVVDTELTGTDGGEAVKTAFQNVAERCADYLWRAFFGRADGPELLTVESPESPR